MFGVPIEGPNVFCDNEAVRKNTTKPESVLNQKHHSIALSLGSRSNCYRRNRHEFAGPIYRDSGGTEKR
jgi:hypothetical protein